VNGIPDRQHTQSPSAGWLDEDGRKSDPWRHRSRCATRRGIRRCRSQFRPRSLLACDLRMIGSGAALFDDQAERVVVVPQRWKFRRLGDPNPAPVLSRGSQRRGVGSAIGEVQNAQRRAAIGTSLRHSGHFFVVGSGAASPRRIRARSRLPGRTIKK
jgi:hypothetical protein